MSAECLSPSHSHLHPGGGAVDVGRDFKKPVGRMSDRHLPCRRRARTDSAVSRAMHEERMPTR
jgi:hypothetical protein